MRPKRGRQLGGAAPRGGRWSRQVSGRASEGNQQWALFFLLGVAVFIVATLAGFGWALDRQLRGGIITQHVEATQRPTWVPIETLPAYVPLAFLIVVDPHFLQRSPLAEGVERSTLSQELVRQVHQLDGDLRGRSRELMMGPLLETRLSQREILELYLNRIFLGTSRGWHVFGIHDAAQEYFGKEPQELTLGETATLAGMLLPPRIVDPRVRAGAVGARRNEVLREMWHAGVIDDAGYVAAVQEPLGFQPGLEFRPMTRPLDWTAEPEVIRVQPEEEPADTVPAPPR